MNSYSINYEQLRQHPALSDMLSALERAFHKFSIDFYLVGAVARDVWMSGINNLPPRRTTGDIDFAVMINDKGGYETLKEFLITNEDFHPVKDNAFVLIWKDRAQVDLLPFGAIEEEDGRVTIEGSGFTTMRVPGFAEVYKQGLPELNLQGQHSFKFCTLPGIVLLKMIAWDDRPEIRRDDIKDISDILHHFFSMYDEEIWNNHSDLFAGEDTDLSHVAARVMGREMGKIARRNSKLFARLENILAANTGDVAQSKMAAIMVEYFSNTMTDNVLLLRQIKVGFSE